MMMTNNEKYSLIPLISASLMIFSKFDKTATYTPKKRILATKINLSIIYFSYWLRYSA
jgi:hypothetical protein